MRTPAPAVTSLILVIGTVGLPNLAGCNRRQIVESTDGPSPEELLSFYSPKRIKILPHTKVRSFDGDLFPDGIEVSLQALDGTGDSIKAFGVFQFELHAYRPAAGNRRGERIYYWKQPVQNEADQREFWEHVTNTYQFRLGWEGRPLAPGQHYILDATYRAPDGRRLVDSYEMDFRIDRREVLEALQGAQP